MAVAPSELELPETEQRTDTSVPWMCVVWDDPVNLMTYVTYVFMTYFGYSKSKAKRLMMEVHTDGKAAVASGTREEMERDVAALHGYGLWATMEKSK